jgi:hypothetical protein
MENIPGTLGTVPAHERSCACPFEFRFTGIEALRSRSSEPVPRAAVFAGIVRRTRLLNGAKAGGARHHQLVVVTGQRSEAILYRKRGSPSDALVESLADFAARFLLRACVTGLFVGLNRAGDDANPRRRNQNGKRRWPSGLQAA